MIKLPDGRDVYEVKDVCQMTNLCADTIRNWCRTGRLKAKKIGRSYYTTLQAINNAIERTTPKE